MSQVKASAKAAFARQLRAWRAKKGWSQVELGDKLGYSDALISGIENRHKTPTADFAARCDDVFDAPGTFAELQELIAREAWPDYFAPVVEFEKSAVQVHEYSPIVVPGLLQTCEYARAVIGSGQPYLTSDEVEQKVSARMERQGIFQRESGRPRIWEVIPEGALRHVIGSPEIMRDQVDRLITLATSSDVVLQALPFSAYDHPGTDGPILIFDFDNAPSVAYMECMGGGMIVESPERLASITTSMSLIRAAALSPRGSLMLLRTIRDGIA
jgi:transcriptional regulator with XRE-family HTH domain